MFLLADIDGSPAETDVTEQLTEYHCRRHTQSYTPCSKIRLVTLRHVGLLVAVVFVGVVGADGFLQWTWIRHVGQRRAKGCGENSFVLHGHLHLHELAAVPAPNIANEHPIFLSVSLDGVFDIVVIPQPVTF